MVFSDRYFWVGVRSQVNNLIRVGLNAWIELSDDVSSYSCCLVCSPIELPVRKLKSVNFYRCARLPLTDVAVEDLV